MFTPARILAVTALAVGLCPVLALACDEDSNKDKEVTRIVVNTDTHVQCVVETKATECTVKVKAACKAKATATAVADKTQCPQTKIFFNTNQTHRAWEPGHLIEPVSMKLGPGDDLNAPEEEQWVRISSMGSVKFHLGPWEKKAESRTPLQVYGPYRVVLQSQLP